VYFPLYQAAELKMAISRKKNVEIFVSDRKSKNKTRLGFEL